jgi:hypothetical protein
MTLLYQPLKVFILCAVFGSLSLLFNGSLFQLYKLHRDQKIIESQISVAKAQVFELNGLLKAAKDPSFIERQAVDNYDLVNEQDLVFVFAEQD